MFLQSKKILTLVWVVRWNFRTAQGFSSVGVLRRGPAYCPGQQQQNAFNKNLVQPSRFHSDWALQGMKRPILDTIASTLFKLENARVEASSEIDEKGRSGEPMEWSDSTSMANKFSEAIASNSLGYQFKQFVADIVAGDYDEQAVNAKVDAFINDQSAPIAMFSFTTCPFCRRAKDYLDEKGIKYNVMELDELDGNGGNEIRAILGKRTRRTSVPSIFVGGNYIGGCNDGPGLLPLGASGELDKMLQSL
jgi:glutaredoxin 3